MTENFNGKTVIITGASSGIGKEASLLFAKKGANVVIAARTLEKLEEVENVIKNTGANVLKVQTDVLKSADIKNLIKKALDTFGSIDILVNNAGYSSQGDFENVDLKELEQTIDVNLKAPVRLIKHALPHIKKSPAGRIINVASILGIIPIPKEAVYSSTKFALRGFSYALAEELQNTRVKVCLICPGPVDTPFIMDSIDKLHDLVFSPPMSTPKEIAELIIKSAIDGKMERIKPVHTGVLAKIGFLLPPVASLIKPIMIMIGAKRKKQYMQKKSNP
ncbi:MAG: SDR family NAD(P)-dependent oxidoreductase [Candidatus Dadabacteria bacterium]|nr:SDR family NAD(P)-dependent oxidoreductase [Candidatus Dadabacteria bacterium]NIQ16619.1 SDR family NAD(P)-dependent oxidoreductase [Candidatus Dadabacteria bacterium]